MTAEEGTGAEFIAAARAHLVMEYLPKIRSCVGELSDDQVWWRSSEAENSVGNLLLHLSANIRQWIVSGLGGAADARVRQAEFDERRVLPKEELLQLFESAVMEADAVLGRFDASKLTEVRHFQKWDYSCLYAIMHVVEHAAQHMGQIVYITKLCKKTDLKFLNL